MVPLLSLSFVSEFPLVTSKEMATFQNQTCVMDVESYDDWQNFLSPSIGFSWIGCNGVSVLASYKGLFNKDTQIQEYEVRAGYSF